MPQKPVRPDTVSAETMDNRAAFSTRIAAMAEGVDSSLWEGGNAVGAARISVP